MSQTSGWPSISMGSASMGSTHCESKLIFKYYRKFQKAKLEFATQGDGTPLQYSCLENPMGGGAWWAAVRGVAKSRTWLSDFTFTFHMHWRRKWQPTPVFLPENPRDGEPGGLPSMGLHRVGHDWSDLTAAAATNYIAFVLYLQLFI